jgi:hypothetical protein
MAQLLKITEMSGSGPKTSVVPRKRGPGGVRQKTLDSRFRRNDDIKEAGVAYFRNA